MARDTSEETSDLVSASQCLTSTTCTGWMPLEEPEDQMILSLNGHGNKGFLGNGFIQVAVGATGL